MNHRNLIRSFVLLTTLCNSACLALAQEPDESAPKPAARSIPPIPDVVNSQADQSQDLTGQIQPDTTSLTGVQNPTTGSQQLAHSYWVPGFQYANTVQSGLSQSGSWASLNYFLANATLVQNWGHSTLGVNYSGGGFVSTDSTQGSGQYQQLNVLQDFHLGRSDVQFLDEFSYLPQSSFGFGAGTNLGVAGVGGSIGVTLPGLNTSIVPNQSILTSIGPRYSNAFAVQASYLFSSRDSITASASYGILRFTESGNIDSDMPTASIGYNRSLTAQDTIGLVYRFAAYHYAGFPQAIGDHVASVAYGRKITGRLALQLYGGPEITMYRTPVNGQSRRTSGYASAILSYNFATSGVSASYTHGLSAGSGVLLGSELDQITLTASKRLGRVWTAQFNFGFGRNTPITNSSSSSTPGQNFDDWFVGVGVTRPVGRDVSLAFAYNAQIQQTTQTGCTTQCSSSNTQNIISLSFQWHTRPLVLR